MLKRHCLCACKPTPCAMESLKEAIVRHLLCLDRDLSNMHFLVIDFYDSQPMRYFFNSFEKNISRLHIAIWIYLSNFATYLR